MGPQMEILIEIVICLWIYCMIVLPVGKEIHIFEVELLQLQEKK